MTNFLLSVVIPVFNEEKNIQPLVERLLKTIGPTAYEIIFVDDGSSDGTAGEIKKLGADNDKIKLISFYRNFGHQMALTAGYQAARGDCVVSLDADLQDPPEIVAQMITKWQQGAKIVYARRGRRDTDDPFKKNSAGFFYKVMNYLSDTPIPDNVGDFRLLDRTVVDFLNRLPEHSRFLRGLVAWGGFPAATVTFDRGARHSGATHYTLGKMINFAFEGITSFSTKPLYLATYLGFTAAVVGFVGIIYAILGRIFLPQYWVTGWTGLFVGVMFLGGVQLLTIGIIGEYIGKIYREVQKRPPYLVKEKINL